MEELLIPLLAFVLLARSKRASRPAPKPDYGGAAVDVPAGIATRTGGVERVGSGHYIAGRPGGGLVRPPTKLPPAGPAPIRDPAIAEQRNGQRMAEAAAQIARFSLPDWLDWRQTAYASQNEALQASPQFRSINMLWYALSRVVQALLEHPPAELDPIDGRVTYCPAGTALSWSLVPVIERWANTPVPRRLLVDWDLDGRPPWERDPAVGSGAADPAPPFGPSAPYDPTPTRQALAAMGTLGVDDLAIAEPATTSTYLSAAWLFREIDRQLQHGGFDPRLAPVACVPKDKAGAVNLLRVFPYATLVQPAL